MTDLICITCPKGCHLTVDEAGGYAVTGNGCPRGVEYGKNELLHPVRTVTSTVRVEGAAIARLPVKTDRPLPKEKMFDCMALLNTITVHAPVHTGDILAARILGTEANLVSTKSLE
ncbi:DUF1667 domain-containing protein [Dysosmobacter sp.]